MRNIRVYDKILKKYIPFNGIYSFDDPTLVFEEGTGVLDSTEFGPHQHGREIFEGDVVEGYLQNKTVSGTVKYDPTYAAYMIFGKACHSIKLKELYCIKIISRTA